MYLIHDRNASFSPGQIRACRNLVLFSVSTKLPVVFLRCYSIHDPTRNLENITRIFKLVESSISTMSSTIWTALRFGAFSRISYGNYLVQEKRSRYTMIWFHFCIPSSRHALGLTTIGHFSLKKCDDYPRISRDPGNPGSSPFAIQELIVVHIVRYKNRDGTISTCPLMVRFDFLVSRWLLFLLLKYTRERDAPQRWILL
jgi:hypothetical protein